MNRILKIPKFLHELHGEEASILSIFLVYVTGIAFAIFCVMMSPAFLHGYYKWVLAAMALDIGGGVVSNLSQGTAEYYGKRPGTRWIFILVHGLHPVILWILFSYMNGILIIGVLILTFTTAVNSLSDLSDQRLVSACLFVITLMLINLLVTGFLPVLFLTVFAMKLIVGFGVRWYVRKAPDQ